jgi:hypothetical protein
MSLLVLRALLLSPNLSITPLVRINFTLSLRLDSHSHVVSRAVAWKRSYGRRHGSEVIMLQENFPSYRLPFALRLPYVQTPADPTMPCWAQLYFSIIPCSSYP